MRTGNENVTKKHNGYSRTRQLQKPGENKLEQKLERHIAQVIARLLNNKTTYLRGDWE